MEVTKDVGAGRPKGIFLEDALMALKKEYNLRYISSDQLGPVIHSVYKGFDVEVNWWAMDRIGIPTLKVTCERSKWHEIRAFLQRSGLFREYPKKGAKK